MSISYWCVFLSLLDVCKLKNDFWYRSFSDILDKLLLHLNPDNNLPMTTTCSADSRMNAVPGQLSFLSPYSSNAIVRSVTDSRNRNVTKEQKELLSWHFKLGHLSFKFGNVPGFMVFQTFNHHFFLASIHVRHQLHIHYAQLVSLVKHIVAHQSLLRPLHQNKWF